MKRFTITGLSMAGVAAVAMAALLVTAPHRADAHCQVPCGIYDDAARIAHLREDATTIEKAMKSINQMAGGHDPQSVNQAIRWVTTKEDHASHIIEVVSQYFLTQKVKPVDSGDGKYQDYLKSLADHHAVMVAAMKCKQTVDEKNVAMLRSAIDALEKHYK